MTGIVHRLLARFPHAKRLLKYLMRVLHLRADASSHYVRLQEGEAGQEAGRLRTAWQMQALPARQRELVDVQLRAYRSGEPVDVFDVLVRAFKSLPEAVRGMSVLEVGCSSGFYSEVLEIAGLDIAYTGCDYSEAFIDMAQQKYSALRFDVEDATGLKYGRESFDVVISGCCLLHIPEYQIAVAEAARVARHYVIFHRTPVVLGQPNVYFRKRAYGVETIEIHFNEPEFLALLDQHGLELIAAYTLDESVRHGVGSANRTYVCRKSSQ